MLLLDAGNSLFSGGRQDLNQLSQGRLLVEAMNLMGYDALALGPRDLQEGVALLRERMAEAKFAILSANVMVDGELLAEPYAIFERGGLRIAVLGLTSPDITAPEGMEALDPAAAIEQYLPELEEQSDLLVVLGALGPTTEQELALKFQAIDLIVGGGSSIPSNGAIPEGSVAIVRAGGLGEYLGITAYDSGSAVGADRFRERSLLLGPDIPDDPEMAALKTRYQGEYGQAPTASPS